MLVIYFAVLTVICSASAAPSRQKRFDAFDPFPFMSPFAGSYSYARPFGFGGFAAAGFPFSPFPVSYIPVPIPQIPDFSQFLPWYQGPNVCETVKEFEEPDEMSKFLSDGFSGTFDYSHESQNCRGENDKYVCVKRINTPTGSKMVATKYECCHGFIRNPSGPGCIENEYPSLDASSAPPTDTSSAAPISPFRINDQFTRYNYYTSNSQALNSGVEKVPAE